MLSIPCNSHVKLWRNKKDLQRITRIKSFINKYNWKGINFPSEKDDWKKLEKNNVTIALTVLYATKEKIYPAYVSKYNSNCEKQVNFLMISKGEKQRKVKSEGCEIKPKGCEAKSEGQRWHYLAVKKLSALLRRITSKHHGSFYCLNCLYYFGTEKKLDHIKKYVKIKIFKTS